MCLNLSVLLSIEGQVKFNGVVEIYFHICLPCQVMMMLLLLSRLNTMAKSFARRDDKNTKKPPNLMPPPLAIMGIDGRESVVIVAVAVAGVEGVSNGMTE